MFIIHNTIGGARFQLLWIGTYTHFYEAYAHMWFNYTPIWFAPYNKSQFKMSIQFLILRGVRTSQGYQRPTPLTTTPSSYKINTRMRIKIEIYFTSSVRLKLMAAVIPNNFHQVVYMVINVAGSVDIIIF